METLFEYQKVGALWLSGQKYALLADEMGLGKSAQAITALGHLHAKPVLVLCPAVARLNWMREFEKFSSRTLTILPLLTGRDAARVPSADVTICSYDLATTPAVTRVLSRQAWSVCVLDEAHYLKNRKAKRTRAAFGFRAERIWALTGTPAPNDPSELWPLLRLFGATALDYWAFLKRFCVYRETPFGTTITGGQRLPELRALMAPILLRRRKDEVMADLPAIHYGDIVVEPTKVDRNTWEFYFPQFLLAPHLFQREIDRQTRMVEAVTQAIGTGSDSMKILEGLEPQIKSLRQFTGLQKVPRVLELLRAELEANAYDKIVVFGVHKMVLSTIRDELQRDFGAVLIYGGTPPEKRDMMVRRFQKDPRCRVFVGQIIAAGTAISLTAAHQVLFIEADWTPANNQQAAMRVHRIGQNMPVTVRFVGMAGSIDERIQRVLKNKTRTLTALFDPKKTANVFAD